MMGKNNNLTSVGDAYPKISIKSFNWTDKQKEFIDLSLNDEMKYMFCSSPAGTGKTILSLFCSLKLLLRGNIDKILYVRNPIESSSSRGLGFIKGTTEDKLEPYTMPMVDNLYKLLDPSSMKMVDKLGCIEVVPLGFCKGRTFDRTAIIVDEAEDFTGQDFRLIMTRLGRESRMFIIGDDRQSNLKGSKFPLISKTFDKEAHVEKGIYTYRFTAEDIMRSDIIQHVITELDNVI